MIRVGGWVSFMVRPARSVNSGIEESVGCLRYVMEEEPVMPPAKLSGACHLAGGFCQHSGLWIRASQVYRMNNKYIGHDQHDSIIPGLSADGPPVR